MPSWTDKTGRTLFVVPPDGSNPGRLAVGSEDEPAIWLDGSIDAAEVAVALFTAQGQPAPVILPRPDIDPAVSADLGSFGVWLSDVGNVIFAFGSAAIDLEPGSALKVAALIAAYAEAATAARGAEPDPAGVEHLAALITEASRMSPEDAARYLLGKGVRLGEDGDRG